MPKPATVNIIASLLEFNISLADKLNLTGLHGDLHNDSRTIGDGDIFCAIIGHHQDGRRYITQAIKQGAKLVLTECETEAEHGELELDSSAVGVPIVKFFQLNQQLFSLAKSYYQRPQDNMTIVGITGTNGKTTTSQLLAQMLSAHNNYCAIIGTNGAGSVEKLTPVENTTPSACELHQLFNRFKDERFSHIAMEVSSHALLQKRVLADLFDIALFTNLSRDHLDYHGTMASYGAAKKLIFTANKNQVAVVNFDDKQGRFWLGNWPEKQPLWLYGLQEGIKNYPNYVTASSICRHSHGVSFSLDSHLGCVDISSSLLGDFNIDNLLAAISVLLIQGGKLTDIAKLAKQVHAISGRMEASSAEHLPTAVVDYAHTPDALEKALQACRQHCSGDIYVVFGCGGNRDKGKRPLMAQAAEKYADYLVVTNDNPRSEDPQQIANDIVSGFTKPDADHISIILEREQAVLDTLKKAQAGDIVLLAGKGHEDYVIVPKYDENDVIIGTQKLTYDERLVVAEYYNKEAVLTTAPNEANL
ncbi:MAG: UDP-N-acetylmuramoyl-L-alanyl-D-glutamate--2,6-diaminopimelate ligase [Colwellia sp.]|nr:UDP-N-acetylmuramoyl-L-alanyl-D-glutamate--2,6-diaminopimelate ligase [Colwellia sp.]